MTELERQRRLRIQNRLVELGGADLEDLPPGPELPSTWGKPGSLARRMLPAEEYTHLMELHEAMLSQERARYGRDHPPAAALPEAAPVRAPTTPAVPARPIERVDV